MNPCKHLDYTPGKYTSCEIVELSGFSCRVRHWKHGPVWTEGPGNEGNPVNVQFCGKGRGRINGIFQCYNPGEMGCYEPAEPKPKIFLYCLDQGPEWFVGYALAEDGTGLAGHVSSSISFSMHDMGLTSDWKHEQYNKHYPQGYELEWIDQDKLAAHEGFQAAFAKNKEMAEKAKQTEKGA